MPSATVSVGNVIIAKSDETIKVEGNHYFPLQSVQMDYLTPTELVTHCTWKGDANYFSINTNDTTLENAAWTYRAPNTERAQPLKNYIAFYPNKVTIKEE